MPSRRMNAAIAVARAGTACSAPRVVGSPHAFDMEVRVGAGAYVCGEETSLLESLEGKRGIVRAKPPLPAHKGLFGKPTVINNVLSLASVPFILDKGAEAYTRLRHGPLARHDADPARRQRQAWRPVRDGLRRHARRARRRYRRRHAHRPAGQGRAGRRPARRLFPARAVRHAVRLRGLRRQGRPDRPWRHRGVRRHASTWRKQARFAMEFCAIESCGKCTPCRIGSTRGVETIDKIIAGERDRRSNIALVDRPLQHHEVRLALRARRLHALSGDERAEPFPGGFRPGAGHRCRPRNRGPRHDHSIQGNRLRHARARNRETIGDADHRRQSVTVPEGTSIMRAAMEAGHEIPKLCATDMRRRLRLLPALPGRDRGPRRHAGLLHDAGRERHGRPHPDRAAEAASAAA